MLNTFTPGPDRWKLGFREAVLSNFDFLAFHGLRPVRQEVTFVRYESSEVFVNVYHGRGSYELGVEIGRLKDPQKRELSIGGVVDWAGAYEAEGFGKHVMFQVGTREGVLEFVAKLAALVRKYAIPLVRNDGSAWNTALELQARRRDEYIKGANLAALREKAEAAWHAKDYAHVVELYSHVREDLTEVEVKKLVYAERQALAADAATSRSSPQKKR